MDVKTIIFGLMEISRSSKSNPSEKTIADALIHIISKLDDLELRIKFI